MAEIAAVVMALIIERPMCVDCIATRAQVSPEAIKTRIDQMRATLTIKDGTGRCRVCGRQDASVFWLPAHQDELPPD